MARSRGVKIYALGSLAAPVAALVRNVVIARLLGPELFGLAVTLIVTAQFFDTVLDAGSDKFIVQNRDGDEARVLATTHAAMVIRGIVSALLMLAAAWPLAMFYRQPELVLPLALLALVPLATGLWNLDVRRLQKDGDFSAEGRQILVAELCGLCVALIAAFTLRNYYAALWSLIARSAAAAVMSHVVARRPYRLAIDPLIARRLWRFGWPLVLNGGLVFLGSQGDRVLIGRFLGPIDLGLYSTALLLIFYPTAILQRVLSGLHYPILAARRDGPDYRDAEGLITGQFLIIGAASAIGFTLLTPTALPIIYGKAFVMPALTVALIGLLQIVRMIRVVPATVAFAHGLTGNVLLGNILRLVSFPLAILLVMRGHGLIGLVIGFALGEFVALIGTQLLLARKLHQSLGTAFGLVPVLVATFASCLCLAEAATAHFSPMVIVTAIVATALLVIALFLHRGTRLAYCEACGQLRRLLRRA